MNKPQTEVEAIRRRVNRGVPCPCWRGHVEKSRKTGDEPVGLPWTVILGFLRPATNPHVFAKPLTLDQAIDRVDTWLSHPNTRLVSETDQHWQILKELIEESGTAGNFTTDAHLAALAISHAARLASCDADFGRFRHLRWENLTAI